MSHQCIADAMAPWEAHYKEKVMQATWGHLAPKKNKTYKGRVVFAVGCFGSDDHNPMPISSEFEELSSSPWFYDALMEFLRDIPKDQRESGNVYEWVGTFRNYAMDGTIKCVYKS